ncbi:hypothetical protein [Mixta gaviniae]|uniref:Uncharacterized protein n=1 Tax=Mixta gaviniae TaxID=665914 RepID=A0A1X1EF14_9GAMM|nr:hypothetical protein [Mixta gaviniae]AUX92298.1 hypothetical protein C2E15_03860 [Mixta gaviniae]ORM87413.1 hypothetical protein HA44_01375 [Mixta gaviniae]
MFRSNLEEKLYKTGFSAEEIGKLRANAENHSTSLEIVLSDLSKIFRSRIYICIALVIIWMLSVTFQGTQRALPLGASMLIALGLIAWFTPIKLSWKSWLYQRSVKKNAGKTD